MSLLKFQSYSVTSRSSGWRNPISPIVGAIGAADLKPWVLTSTAMAGAIGVFGAVLWGYKGAALGALLGGALGYVAAHPDSPTVLAANPPK